MKKNTIQDIEELDYMRSSSAAVLEQTPKRSRALLYTIVIFITILFVWAAFADLDEVTRGTGQVIPSQKVQVIQNLEGGIIAEILIKEGQIVNKGQVLLRIDDNTFESTFMESNLRLLELMTKASRLKAEANGDESYTVPDQVLKEKPELARNEQLLFTSHLNALNNSLSIIKQQTQKYRHELSEAQSKLKQIDRNLKLAKKELNIIKPLYKSGAVSQVKLIQVERQVNNFKGEYDETLTSLPRLRGNIKESQQKEKEIISNFKNKAREELNNTLAEIPRIRESLVSIEDKLTRTSVRSPVKGTVKQLLVNTIDGVVKPGMDLVEIVPLDDALVVEAKIKPKDIAYIFPNQNAKVKFTAYDSTKYGSLDAKVIFISADTITETDGVKEEAFYRVKVKTNQNFLKSGDKNLPIIPGMVAEVDILTGKKSVLNYFFKPITRAKDNAFTER